MKASILKIMLPIFLFSAALYAQDSSIVKQDSIPPLPLVIGEKLTFKIRYGFIRAGTAEMKIMSQKDFEGQEAIHIQTTARSVPAFNWIYKVKDVLNIYVDAQTLMPIYMEKKLREGSYKADLFINYSFQDSIAKGHFLRYRSDMSIKKEVKFDVPLKDKVYDVLTAFYYVRTQPLIVGEEIEVTAHEKQKVYDLQIKVYRKEVIETEAGKFRCLMVEPLLKGEGIFKQKGRLKIWMTDDEYKIPVQMTSKVVVGHITTELMKIEGLPKNIPSRVN